MDGGFSNMGQEETLPLSNAIGRLSIELERAACDCAELQVLTSSLLEKLNHPDLASEFMMLQDLDRLHQTLENLNAYAHQLSGIKADQTVGRAHLEASIQLMSLRARMFPRADNSSDDGLDGTTWL